MGQKFPELILDHPLLSHKYSWYICEYKISSGAEIGARKGTGHRKYVPR
jgi:hypothetical protein